MTERHARILGRLAEVGMALVEDLAAAVLAAEDAHEKAALAGACHKFTRSVRQSLALEARFARDAERVRQEAEIETAEAPARRRAEAKARLDRLIWTEAEDDLTAKFWEEGAARHLAEAEFTDPDTPLDALVDRIAQSLRDAEQPRTKTGKPETVIFEWKIVDPKDPDPPPQREGDREAVEGVEGPNPRRRWSYGLPGEFGPNGETGEDRITGCI